MVSHMVHDKDNTKAIFVGEPNIPWRWQDMVAQFDEESMQFVVEGSVLDPVRSRGLVSCRLQKTDEIDHTRLHAFGRSRGDELEMVKMVWDYVLVRDNGTQVFIHPNYSSNKVDCNICVPEQDHEVSVLSGRWLDMWAKEYGVLWKKRAKITLRFGGAIKLEPAAMV